ncbi:YihY/virulence factor BrkB family protein [Terriglobus roseus]|nr:YihY/virulence factor BrkB family protein [Terriglobus roseus]
MEGVSKPQADMAAEASPVGSRSRTVQNGSQVDSTTARSTQPARELRSALMQHARTARSLGHDWGHEGLRLSDKIRLAYWNAFQHDCLTTAKATAYSAIFAIFPALGFFAAMVTLLPYSGPVRSQIAIFLNRVLPASVAPLFEQYLINAHSSPKSTGVLLGAAVVSVVGAAGVLGTLMEGFRRAYNLTEECWGPGIRGVVRKQVQSFLLVPIALVPLTVASVLVVFGHLMLLGLMRFSPSGWDSGLYFTANTVRWIGSLSATAAVLAFIYRYAVPVRPTWRDVVPGAAFATATWFVSTLAFGFYVTHFANYSRVYGSLGTGIVLLVWLFLTALTVLCGAELNAELARDANLVVRPAPAPVVR